MLLISRRWREEGLFMNYVPQLLFFGVVMAAFGLIGFFFCRPCWGGGFRGGRPVLSFFFLGLVVPSLAFLVFFWVCLGGRGLPGGGAFFIFLFVLEEKTPKKKADE